MKTQLGFLGITLCAVLSCSSSESDNNSLASPGAGSSSGNPGAAGGVNINTNSGDPNDPDAGSGMPCSNTLEVTYRDFSEAHPDFEMPFAGDVVRRGLVQSQLGPDHKPVFADRIGGAAVDNDPLAVRTDTSPPSP